jgi:hypothetical protein
MAGICSCLGLGLLGTQAQYVAAAEIRSQTEENISAWRSGHFGHATQLLVEGYYRSVDAGGGEFVLEPDEAIGADNGCTGFDTGVSGEIRMVEKTKLLDLVSRVSERKAA